MAIEFFNPPVPPSEGTSVTQKVNLKKAEFGDGYVQTTRVGLNHIRRSLKLSWDLLHPDDAIEILNFLRDQGGDLPFFYTPSDELLPIKWTCADWSDTRIQNGYRSIQATFEESFDERGLLTYATGIGVARGRAGVATNARSSQTIAAVAQASSAGSFALAEGLRVRAADGAAAGTSDAVAVGSTV